MQVGVPSASLRYTDSGVSRSDSTSRTTGTRTRMPGARGSGACGDCGDGDADLVTRRFLGGRMGGVDGGCMPPSPTQVGKKAVRECAGVHAPNVAALRGSRAGRARSEERHVGNEGEGTCGVRWRWKY